MNNSLEEKKDVEVPCQTEDAFNYDEILGYLGQMGKFQFRSFLLLCLPAVFFGPVIMIYVFIGAIPRYRCYVEGCENITTTDFEPWWLNRTIPWDLPDQFMRQCRRYDISWDSVDQCHFADTTPDVSNVTKCLHSVYDTSQFHSTIVTEFQLSCENEWKQTIVSTVFMAGMLIGAVTLGNVSDIFGRRATFTAIIFVLASAMTASAFAQDFLTFTILRFVCGITDIGLFLVLFVWGIEAVGQKYRVVCGFIYQIITSIGSISLGFVAYYVRDWRSLQLIIGAPMFLLLFIPLILPESTRWLISRHRYAEAKVLILEAAKMNNKSISTNLITIKQEDNTSIKTQSTSTETIFDVFKSKVLCRRLIILFGAWMATTAGYYGITYSAANLSGDFYLNYGLSMLIELPSGILGIYSIQKFGHRSTLCGGLIFGGIGCLITGLVPDDPPAIRICFSLIGKFFITCVLAVNFSYTIELFPTSTRSAVIGLCSTMDKIGGILAPSLASIGRMVDQSTPYIIFAVVNIVIGSLCMMLPETSKSPLPTTIQEAEDIEKYTLTLSDFQWLRSKFKMNSKKTPTSVSTK